MTKRFLTAIMLVGLWTGSATASAEELEGIITSIDAKKNQMDIVPAGHSGDNISVSVAEYIKANHLAGLNDLDVGKKVSMTIRKDPAGRWVMRSLDRADVVVPEADDHGLLKTTGKPKNTPFPRIMSDKSTNAVKR